MGLHKVSLKGLSGYVGVEIHGSGFKIQCLRFRV